ncbi:MAG TPA: hypothetical protein VFF76_03380 [Holophagaceae bacterium]|nr:hypothetical protein [Holophagaceae bacterium]
MSELDQNPATSHDEAEEGPISVRQILKDNWILARCLIIFILMLAVPALLAWKFDLFLVANN